MFRKLLFPKLLESESLTIETDLSKIEAITRLEKVVGPPFSILNLGMYFMRDNPLFRGKFNKKGFEIMLFSDGGELFSNFSPPMITANWLGEDSVTIEAKIHFTNFHKFFVKICSVFELFFGLVIVVGPQLGLALEVSTNDVSIANYPLIAFAIFVVSILVFVAFQLIFFTTSVSLMNRAMRHSKKEILNLFN